MSLYSYLSPKSAPVDPGRAPTLIGMLRPDRNEVEEGRNARYIILKRKCLKGTRSDALFYGKEFNPFSVGKGEVRLLWLQVREGTGGLIK